MIGLSNRILILTFFFLFSCSSKQANESELMINSDSTSLEVETVENIDNSAFIDIDLVGDIEVQEQETGVFYAAVASETFEILSYEGLLSGARYAEGGFELDFKPYSVYNDDLEYDIWSPNMFNLSVYITRTQSDYLEFIDFTKENKLLAWDYFECIFKVNYYLDSDQNNIPLKFSNLGKLEWDG